MYIVREIVVTQKHYVALDVDLVCQTPVLAPLRGSTTGKILLAGFPSGSAAFLIGRALFVLPVHINDDGDQIIAAHLSYDKETCIAAIDVDVEGKSKRVCEKELHTMVWKRFIENVESGEDIEALIECLAAVRFD